VAKKKKVAKKTAKKKTTTKKPATKKKAAKKSATKKTTKKKGPRLPKGVELIDGKIVMAPDVFEKYLHEHSALTKINKKNDEIKRLKAVMEEKKEQAATAKKSWENAQQDLNDLVQDLNSPQKRLPGMAAADLQEDSAVSESSDKPTDDKWMDQTLREAGISNGHAKKLEAIGVETFRQLEHLRSGKDPDRPRGLSDVKGLGEKAVTEIETITLDFIASNSSGTEAGEGVEKGMMVKLTRDIRGAANKKDGMFEGTECEVVKVDGDKIQVKSKNGKNVTLEPEDFSVSV